MISKIVLRDQRRETERGLVQQHQPRARHQRARDHQHLLLSARERAGDLVDALGEHREALEHLAQIALVSRRRAAAEGAEHEIFAHGQLRATCRVLPARRPMPSRAISWVRRPLVRAPANSISPPAIGTSPIIALQQRALAGAVGADQRHHLALVDRERHAGKRDDLAVGDAQVADREQAHAVLPR